MESTKEELKKRIKEEHDTVLPDRIYFIFDQFPDNNVNVRMLDTTQGAEGSEELHVLCTGLQNILFEKTAYVIDTGHAVMLEREYNSERESIEEKIKNAGDNVIVFDRKKKH
tara:strand:+ start:7705 stop:8040 length:336 start_codon:yes stop_codon:yes gene_type:complete